MLKKLQLTSYALIFIGFILIAISSLVNSSALGMGSFAVSFPLMLGFAGAYALVNTNHPYVRILIGLSCAIVGFGTLFIIFGTFVFNFFIIPLLVFMIGGVILFLVGVLQSSSTRMPKSRVITHDDYISFEQHLREESQED